MGSTYHAVYLCAGQRCAKIQYPTPGQSGAYRHVCCIFFSFLLLYGFRSGSASNNKLQKQAVMSASIAIGFGIVTEILQPELSPGRIFEVTDILANIIGSISGATAYLVVHLKR